MTDDATLIVDLMRAGVAPELIGRVVEVLLEASRARDASRDAPSHFPSRDERDAERDARSQQALRAQKYRDNKRYGSVTSVTRVTETVTPERDERHAGHLTPSPPTPPSPLPSPLSPITPIPSTLSPSPSEPPPLIHTRAREREIDDHNFDKPERERASRLPKEWEPNGRDLSFATRTLGGLLAVEDELAKFRDHWAAKPGVGGRKLDWDATWRNWVRTAKDRQRGPPRTPSFIELENELKLRKAHAYDSNDDQTPDFLGDHFTDPPD